MSRTISVEHLNVEGPSRRSDPRSNGPGRDAEDTHALVLWLVARQQGVPVRMLLHGSRCRAPVALARQIAMYLMHVCLGLSMTDVARRFGRDRTTVAHACARIEDMRDDGVFEARMLRLERAVDAARRVAS